MKLSMRLEEIAKRVLPGAIVIDVGTDHAYLPISLIERGICSKVYGSDLRVEPLQSAYANGKTYCDSQQLILLKQDGLLPLPSDVTTVTISGLGGTLMTEMVGAATGSLSQIGHIIVQPQGHSDRIRELLTSLNYFINDEAIVFENEIFYEIIEFKKGSHAYSSKELLFGPVLLAERNDLFRKRWRQEQEYLLSILKSIPSNNPKFIELSNRLSMIQEVI